MYFESSPCQVQMITNSSMDRVDVLTCFVNSLSLEFKSAFMLYQPTNVVSLFSLYSRLSFILFFFFLLFLSLLSIQAHSLNIKWNWRPNLSLAMCRRQLLCNIHYAVTGWNHLKLSFSNNETKERWREVERERVSESSLSLIYFILLHLSVSLYFNF